MKHYLLLAATTLALASCSNPLSKAYTAKTVGDDLEAIVESGKLDPTQCQLLIQYVRLGNEPLAGATYQQLLDQATALQAQAEQQQAAQRALAAKAAAAAEARLQQLRAVAAVTVFRKGFLGSDSSAGHQATYLTFDVAIQNKSPKDIRAIMGMLVFNNAFNRPIKKMLITTDGGIKAGKTFKYGSGIDYNERLDEDLLLRYNSLDSLKIVWQPEKVLFADGTSLAVLEHEVALRGQAEPAALSRLLETGSLGTLGGTLLYLLLLLLFCFALFRLPAPVAALLVAKTGLRA